MLQDIYLSTNVFIVGALGDHPSLSNLNHSYSTYGYTLEKLFHKTVHQEVIVQVLLLSSLDSELTFK